MTHAHDAREVDKLRTMEARLTAEQHEIIGWAAALLGLTISKFIITSALQAAGEVIREHSLIKLTREDSLAFAAAILNPGMPNEALRAAFAQHDQRIVPRSGRSPA